MLAQTLLQIDTLCAGVNVVIDPVGGTLFNEALRSVAWGAHIVVIGFAGGGIPKVC